MAVLASLLAAGCSTARAQSPGGATATSSVGGGTLVDRPLDPAVRALTLTDETGRRTTLAALTGTPLVVTDMLTTCAEICPMTTAAIHAAAAKARGDGSPVQFLEITVDPGRDDVHRLAAYAALYGRAPNWHLLTAGGGTDQLWKALGVYYRRVPSDNPPPKDWLTGRPLTYDVQHQDAVFVIDAEGHERWLTQGSPSVVAKALPTPMRSFLDQQGRNNLSSPDGPVWTTSDVLAALSAVTGEHLS